MSSVYKDNIVGKSIDRDVILEVRNLKKRFSISGGILGMEIAAINAVDSVSFSIKRGETLGLVGESGCGKTTLGKTILRLINPSAGSIIFDGADIMRLSNEEMRQMRKRMQIIFQDPYASLNPRMNVEELINIPMNVFNLFPDKIERKKRVYELLDYVHLTRESINKYPHEFSGGQRQRIAIARALAVAPDFIVCDEPISSLDISTQVQIVNLLTELQKELNLTYLFIAHDLKLIEKISNRVAVMYLGNIIEIASTDELFRNPKHPYTKALFSAIPSFANRSQNLKEQKIILKGEIPDPMHPPSGCHFHTRCWCNTESCRRIYPKITKTSQDHFYRCYNPLH